MPQSAKAKFEPPEKWKAGGEKYPKTPDEAPMENVTKLSQAPEPSKRERIQIISMLADVYDLDNGMYKNGDTDEAVAEILGTMPGFVASIREAEFGPAGGNEDMVALMADLESFAKDAAEKLSASAETNAKLIKAVDRAKEFQERLGRIEKAVGPRLMKRA